MKLSYILFLEVLHISIPYRFFAMNIYDSALISHEVRRYPTTPINILAHKSEKCTPKIYIIYELSVYVLPNNIYNTL